jgi:hypothetical protein
VPGARPAAGWLRRAGCLRIREPDHVAGAADLAACLGDGLAVLGGQQRGDRLDALLDERGRPQKDVEAGVGGGFAPDCGAVLGGGEGLVGVGDVSDGRFPDDAAVVRGADLLDPSAGARDPFTGDEELAVGHENVPFLRECPALLGVRAEHRVHETGGLHHVGDRRAVGLAGDDRGEQPLGLDHLEVVEAERDRGVRLERRRLPSPGPMR